MKDTNTVDGQPRPAATSELGNDAKAEWVALMCVLAEHDRDLYRQLRAEAYEAVERSGRSGASSKDSNRDS